MMARLMGSPRPAPGLRSARSPRANFSKIMSAAARVAPLAAVRGALEILRAFCNLEADERSRELAPSFLDTREAALARIEQMKIAGPA